MRIRWLALATASVLLLPSAASSQDGGKAGLVVTLPASIGVTWNVSPHVALRPDASFSGSWADSTTDPAGATATATNRAVGVGIAALLYLRRQEGLKLYVVPRFGYGRATSDGASPGSASHTSSTNYQVSGSFGAEHSLSRRFAIFGELGLSYSRVRTTNSRDQTIYTGTKSTTQALGTRASVGTILSF
jgi:hypothetical protein